MGSRDDVLFIDTWRELYFYRTKVIGHCEFVIITATLVKHKNIAMLFSSEVDINV